MSSNKDLHTLTSHAELAAAALGSVYAANEFGKAVADYRHETDHYVKAAVGAAVAVGAFHQLQKKEHSQDSKHAGGGHAGKHGHVDEENSNGELDPPHHTRHLLEEAAGAYSLGRELLGDRKHHMAHLIIEAMGATGLVRDLQTRAEQGTHDTAHGH